MKLQINARIFAGIAQLRSIEEDPRISLRGVCVEPYPRGGVIIQAGSGFIAGVWLDVNGEAERPAILRVDDDLISNCARATSGSTLTIIDGCLALADEKARIKYTTSIPWELKEKYRDFKKIIPINDGGPLLSDAINPKSLAKIRKAIKVGERLKGGVIGVELRQKTNCAPIVCTSPYAPFFVGIMTPVEDVSAPMPTWVRSWVEPPPADAPLPVHEPRDAAMTISQ